MGRVPREDRKAGSGEGDAVRAAAADMVPACVPSCSDAVKTLFMSGAHMRDVATAMLSCGFGRGDIASAILSVSGAPEWDDGKRAGHAVDAVWVLTRGAREGEMSEIHDALARHGVNRFSLVLSAWRMSDLSITSPASATARIKRLMGGRIDHDSLRALGVVSLDGLRSFMKRELTHNTLRIDILPESLFRGLVVTVGCASIDAKLERASELTFAHDLIIQKYSTETFSIPDNIRVGGDLILSGSGVTSIGSNVRIGGDLGLKRCPHWDGVLPDNLAVDGSVWLSDCPEPMSLRAARRHLADRDSLQHMDAICRR
jgi:hypothetical protein